MTRFPTTSASQSHQFLTEIATLGLRRALRPFLHPSKPPFVAALVLPPGAVQHIYVDAASKLFAPRQNEYEFSDDFTVVFVDNANGKDVDRAFKTASIFVRTLFLLTAQCDLPTEFALAVDHHGAMPPPTADHVVVAARKLGLGELTRVDAEFLATVPSPRLRAAMTVGRSLASAVRRLRAAKEQMRPAPTTRPRPDSSLLDDLVGFTEAKKWGVQLARDVVGWEAGLVPWSEIDRGAVLFGAPGTGKTKAAEALAAACGLNFFKTSAARWQSKGHLGDFLKAMRLDFAEATEMKPCLMFLEELDSIGDRDADHSDNAQYIRQAVNGVLEAVDDALANEGVVILGATNRLQAIDPALLRAGRIEQVFDLGYPTPGERLSILAVHLRPHTLDLPSSHIRLVSEGMSGAELERAARAAKQRARSQERPLVVDDVIACLPSIRTLDHEELRRVAVHEAGHALVGVSLLPHRLVGVTISDVHVLGRGGQSIGKTVFDRAERTQKMASEYRDEVAMLLGGVAAEEVVFGGYSDGAGGIPGSDLVVATDLATSMVSQLGFGGVLTSEVLDNVNGLKEIRMRRMDIAARVTAALRDEFERAQRVIEDSRGALDRIASELMQRKVLSGEDVVEIISTASQVKSGHRTASRRGTEGRRSR